MAACGLQDGKLYWCDARTDKIERIDLETGENREVVLSSNNMDMFSVSVFEDFIYWSDRWGSVLPSPAVYSLPASSNTPVLPCLALLHPALSFPFFPPGLMPMVPSSVAAKTMLQTLCP